MRYLIPLHPTTIHLLSELSGIVTCSIGNVLTWVSNQLITVMP